MEGFTKLFSSIITSTIWKEDNNTRILWITMLAMRNSRHIVEGSIPGLADMARITTAECEASLAKLLSPDPYSRTKEHEGRRILEVDGGWVILNGEKYRKMMNADERREYKANKERGYRKERKLIARGQPVDNSGQMWTGVDVVDTAEHRQRREEKSAEEKWFASIKAEYAKIGVNADTELVKARAWFATNGNGRIFTRNFFVSWLSRADKSFAGNQVKKDKGYVTMKDLEKMP